MPWQAADPGTLAQDAQGAFHIRMGGNWVPAPKGSVAQDAQGAYHVNSDALTASAAPVADPIGEANAAAAANEHGPVQDVINMLKAVPSGIGQMLQGIGQNATEHPILGNIPALVDTFRRVAADPSGTLAAVGNAVQNATPEQVGRNVVAPLVAGGAAGEGASAVSGMRAAAAEAVTSPAAQLGLRTASGPGAPLAGDTAGPTLDAQNQRVASTVLGADVGVPPTSPVNHTTLAAAREAPGNLLDAGYSLVPEGPLSPAAQAQVAAARGPATITKPTPNVSNAINDIESSLLDPNGQFTGPQLRATRNSLNSDAQAGANSDDADTRAIAHYKRQVVSALDQHLADSLPPGSPVTPDMVQNARATLAKNYMVGDLIGKGGDLNLQQLAKLHRDNPNLLTGNTATVAQFASDHPEVTGAISDADRIAPPSIGGDIANLDLLRRPIGSVGQALFGALGRRLLRGAPGEAIGSAMQAPVAGAGGEFELNPLTSLQPPPGTAYTPYQPGLATGTPQRDLFGTGASNFNLAPESQPAAAQGPGRGISLADVLSTGVERAPEPGLTAGPMGAPAGEGIPFQVNAEHAAGDLATHEPTLADLMEDLRDYAGVKSQGVPEGIVQRSAPPYEPQLADMVSNNASGQTPVSQEFANAQAADRASGVTRTVIDPDGNGTPIRGVDARDLTAPKNHIAIEERPGQEPVILDRGGMAPSQARGLLARYIARQSPLGFEF